MYVLRSPTQPAMRCGVHQDGRVKLPTDVTQGLDAQFEIVVLAD
jgi:hypothetical protein